MIYYIYIDDYENYSDFLKYDYVVEKLRYKKFMSYLNKEDKINCILSSLLIKKYCKNNNIKNYCLGLDENNKPYDINNNFYFNISHTDKMVAVAFDKDKVGLDVEKIEQYTTSQLNYTLNEEEQSKYNITNELFTKIWTIKESYVKQSGNGLLSTFNNVIVNYTNDSDVILNLYINSFNLYNHYLSVCSKNNLNNIKEIKKSDII